MISGVVPVPSDPLGTVPSNQVLMVSLVVPKFDTNILVKSRMTHTLTLLSSISYSKPMSESLAKEQRQKIEKDAVNAILQAASKSNQRFQSTSYPGLDRLLVLFHTILYILWCFSNFQNICLIDKVYEQ